MVAVIMPIRRLPALAMLAVMPLILIGCGGGGELDSSFSFTEKDAAEISDLLDEIESSQKAAGNNVGEYGAEEGEAGVIDVSQAHRYVNLRTGIGAVEDDTLRVTNVFLNVREQPNVRSGQVEQLKEGDHVRLLDFPNARWAHIGLYDGRKGYVSTAYIAQIVTDEDLPSIKAKYDGLYEVNFRFLNVRKEPGSRSQKLGELMAHQIIRPVSIDDKWARIRFGDVDGYVSSDYLKPFMPPLVVRQEHFFLPVLHYRGDDAGIADALVTHLAFLKSKGRKIITMRDFYHMLEQQESRDMRVSEDYVILVVSSVRPDTIRDISGALRASSVSATFFLQTSGIGGDGIPIQLVKTLAANGNDIQSAGHSGDDLRSLTNTQVAMDLAQSRQILEDVTGEDVFAVIYPQGGVNDRVVHQAVERGYLFGVTMTPAIGDEGFSREQFLKLPSNLITADTSEETLKSIVGIK